MQALWYPLFVFNLSLQLWWAGTYDIVLFVIMYFKSSKFHIAWIWFSSRVYKQTSVISNRKGLSEEWSHALELGKDSTIIQFALPTIMKHFGPILIKLILILRKLIRKQRYLTTLDLLLVNFWTSCINSFELIKTLWPHLNIDPVLYI